LERLSSTKAANPRPTDDLGFVVESADGGWAPKSSAYNRHLKSRGMALALTLALALRELLHDLLEHLGGIILAALGALAGLAGLLLLLHLLNALHDLVQDAHRASAAHHAHYAA
jgi:hypothetical protein